MPCGLTDSKPNAAVDVPDARRHRLAGEERSREADRDSLDRSRIVDARRLENSPPRERHRAEPVHDPSGKPDSAGELVVEVDREVVSRRRRVAGRLILRDDGT